MLTKTDDMIILFNGVFIQLFLPLKHKPVGKISNWLSLNGGPSWDRTSDPLIMSQVLLTS